MIKYLYFILLLTSINAAAQGGKHKVYPRIIREMADYTVFDPNKPPGFFSLPSLDPLNGVRVPPGSGIDSVDGMPFHTYGGIYPTGFVNNVWYPGNRGLRIIFDLTGSAAMSDTVHRVNITDIYGWYNANEQAGDTMYFYNLDTIFRLSPANRSILLARPDSLMTPFAKLRITNHFSGLFDSAVGLSINCRYLMIRALTTNRGSFLSIPDFSELCIYGTYNYDTNAVARRPATYTGSLAPAASYGSFVGTNQGVGYDTATFQNMTIIRTYGSESYWDSTRSQTTTASCVFTPDYFPDIGPTQYPAFKRAKKIFFWSIRGASNYLQSIAPGAILNIDNYLAEPEASNFTREGRFFGNYAALWGANASATGTSWAGSPTLGKNQVNYVEPGNEGNFSWSSLVEFWRLRQVYDSVKHYDPTFIVVMPATTEIDPGWVDNICWYDSLFTPGLAVPFDVINFHHYPRNINILGYAGSTAQQVGAYGASPEADTGPGIYTAYTAYKRSVINSIGRPAIKVWNTEYGYNNWGTPSTTTGQAQVPWAEQCVPSRGGIDSLTYKMWLQLRSKIIMMFAIDGYCNFFLHNSTLSCSNDFSLFGACGDVGSHNSSAPYNLICPFPSWYGSWCTDIRMKFYVPISITGLNDTTGLIHAFYQKMDSATSVLTDSVCDVIWKASSTGATASSQTVTIGYRLGNNLQKMVPSPTSIVGTTSSASTSANVLSLATVTELPTLFFGRMISNPNLWLRPVPTVLH
jgi:hypothetical protein